MPKEDKPERLERAKVPAPDSIPGPSPTQAARVSAPNTVPDHSSRRIPSIPEPDRDSGISRRRRERTNIPAPDSIPEPSTTPAARVSSSQIPSIPEPDRDSRRRRERTNIPAPDSIPGPSTTPAARVSAPNANRDHTYSQIPSIPPPAKNPGISRRQPDNVQRSISSHQHPSDPMSAAASGGVERRESRSLYRKVKRYFSRRFPPSIGKHRGGEDSRIIFDEDEDDEERERAPPPPPGEREKYKEFPTSTYNYFFMYDPVLKFKEVNDTCSVWSRSVEDLPHLKSVDEEVASVTDFEAKFEDNFVDMVDPLVEDLASIPDFEVDPLPVDEEERADPTAEDLERIADSVAEDISENIKNTVCQRGSPC